MFSLAVSSGLPVFNTDLDEHGRAPYLRSPLRLGQSDLNNEMTVLAGLMSYDTNVECFTVMMKQLFRFTYSTCLSATVGNPRLLKLSVTQIVGYSNCRLLNSSVSYH